MAASTAASSALSLSSCNSSLNGVALNVSAKPSSVRVASLKVRAEKCEESAVSRRAAISLIAAAAAVSLKPSSAEAAYGEAANIFAPAKGKTDYITYKGDGFSLDIPSKWNPSKETEFPGTVLRYEDNSDALINLAVLVKPTNKSSITDFGPPEAFLIKNSYLLGQQVFTGETGSEGGFEKGAVSSASLLGSEIKESKGVTYYKLNILTRSADGNEGGRHQLITAAVNDGKLFIMRSQAGDKRWFKGAKKFVEGTDASFTVV